MRIFITIILLICFIATTSAQIVGSKKRSFTENKRMEYEYNGFGLNNVLFYVSSAIIMKRVLPKTKDGQTNVKGRVSFENGRAYEYYELVDGASCVFEKESEDQSTLTMRFGQDQDEVLSFVKRAGSGNDQNNYYYLEIGEDKKIAFLGKEWELISWEGVRLDVKEKRNTKVKVDKTKSRGMKMDGTEKKSLFQKKN